MAQSITRDEYHQAGYWLRWTVVIVEPPRYPMQGDAYVDLEYENALKERSEFYNAMIAHLERIDSPYYSDQIRVAFRDREEAFIFKLSFG